MSHEQNSESRKGFGNNLRDDHITLSAARILAVTHFGISLMEIRSIKSPSGQAASGCAEIMEGEKQIITEGQLETIQ